MSTEHSMLHDLMILADRHGHTLYSIHRRKAGWGIEWYDANRVRTHSASDVTTHPPAQFGAVPEQWRDGLVVYGYHSNFDSMVKAEGRRFIEQGDKS